MKTSDEKLAQQINAVFENYDDGFAEHGWAELRKKYPEKENKKLPIWWLTGIAATLLIVAGLYFTNALDTEKVILRANTSKNIPIKPQIENHRGESGTPSSQETIVNKENNVTNYPNQKDNNLNNNNISPQQFAANQKATTISDIEKKTNNYNKGIIENQSKIQLIEENTLIASTQNDNNTAGKNIMDNNAIVEKDAKSINNTKSTKLTTQEFLTEQSKMLTANENKKDIKKNSTSKTTIDVFTGTFFNYHDDNEAKLSAGLGVNANVKVAKSIILSFGAGISQNKVSYDNQVPTQVAEAMFASKNTALNAAPVSGSAYSATAANDVSFNGSMLSIDLPMVVKLYPTSKQDFYISTGINSSTYLSQKYTYNYSLSNFSVQNGTAQPQQQTEKSNLKGFDFANSAIIAIGINQNIGKNILIFEPYYRPALGTMGDKNLRISSAGLNLKFNFNGNAKK